MTTYEISENRNSRSHRAVLDELNARRKMIQIVGCLIRIQTATGTPPSDLQHLAVPACSEGSISNAPLVPGYVMSYAVNGFDFRIEAKPEYKDAGTFFSDSSGLIRRTSEYRTVPPDPKQYSADSPGAYLLSLHNCIERYRDSKGRYPPSLVMMGTSGSKCIPMDSQNRYPENLESNSFRYEGRYTVRYSKSNSKAWTDYRLELECSDYGRGCLRSYIIDSSGNIHGTGQERPAKMEDPLALKCETEYSQPCENNI